MPANPYAMRALRNRRKRQVVKPRGPRAVQLAKNAAPVSAPKPRPAAASAQPAISIVIHNRVHAPTGGSTTRTFRPSP